VRCVPREKLPQLPALPERICPAVRGPLLLSGVIPKEEFCPGTGGGVLRFRLTSVPLKECRTLEFELALLLPSLD